MKIKNKHVSNSTPPPYFDWINILNLNCYYKKYPSISSKKAALKLFDVFCGLNNLKKNFYREKLVSSYRHKG